MGRPKGSKNKPKVKPVEAAPIAAKVPEEKLVKAATTPVIAPVEVPKVAKKDEPKPELVAIPVDPETQKAIDKARKEFMEAMARFSKEVKVGDPDAVQKLFSYIPNHNPGVNW